MPPKSPEEYAPAVESGSGGDSIKVHTDPYRLVKARVCGLLDLLRIGVTFERAAGDRLFYRDGDREIGVLDLVGGYGSLLLGHNHPALVAEAQRLLANGVPIHAQGSRRTTAGRLAVELARRAGGDFRVVLANSGAEAIEAAMKHAILETGSRTFIALEGAFHGKTLGAVQLTANDEVRADFELRGLNVLRVRPNDIAHLEETFDRAGRAAAFIYEPVQGEGGVRPLAPEFVQRAAVLCARTGAALVADEIQAGLGRTGTFLASEALGVKPDYIALSKALGGGLAKVAALLVSADRYVADFDLKHTSTYAEDDFSCAIALKALELIDDDMLARAREKGESLLAGLWSLARAYPGVIADVRGRGLMIGLELRPQSSGFVLRMLSEQDDLALAVAGYLFNVHRIRILPTLSNPWTLRLEPSSLISDDDIDRFLAAMEDVCVKLHAGDAVALTEYLAEPVDDAPDAVARDGGFTNDPAAWPAESSIPRVAWLCHMIDADALLCFERPFQRLTYARRESYLRRYSTRGKPILFTPTDVRSAAGRTVRLYPIGLFYTSSHIKDLIDRDDTDAIRRVVDNAIDVAIDHGCRVLSLGQYTSIVTLNGTSVRRPGLGLTTGNSYALALALQAVERAQAERGVDPSASTLAIVGASGNIGRAVAEVCAARYRRVHLVGSGKSGALLRLREFAKSIPNATVSTDPATVRGADVVIAAVNAVDTPLGPDAFAENAIVCDVSVPACVRPETWDARPDLMLFKGGIARLPGGEELAITSFPLPAGQTYGCMAEGLLLGFEGVRDATFTGTIRAEHIRRVEAMAARHGFALADFKRSCPLGAERREDVHASTA